VSDSAAERAESPTPLRRSGLRERVAGEILTAAARVLAASGEGASMNDVAAAAGIARGTLYRYFPTRSALVERLRELALEDAATRLAAARVDQVDPLEGLERTMRVFVDLGEVFVVSARERGRPGGDEFEAAIMKPLRTLIERGQAASAIRDDMGPAWLSEALLGLIVAGAAAAQLGKEDTIASIRLLFLDGARER
jgi:TetR/AcrR family transcriptional regulator, mexCD-oprJ operon repressor